MATLATRAWGSLVILIVVIALLILLCAGTTDYWQAWVYLALLAGLSGWITQDLLQRDQALLERRMKGGPTAEPRPRQRIIMAGASIGFFALVLVPGFDRRFHWSSVPAPIVVLGDALFVLGFGFIARVYRENTYTAATIDVAPGQRVVSTGPYAVVRHPMYASAIVYLIGTPLALASYWGPCGAGVHAAIPRLASLRRRGDARARAAWIRRLPVARPLPADSRRLVRAQRRRCRCSRMSAWRARDADEMIEAARAAAHPPGDIMVETAPAPPIADQIVMLERAALDRWGSGDPGGFLDLYAPEITYFDPMTAARLDGHPAMADYYRPWTAKIQIPRYEMVNPQVVVDGNMALLTYNLVNFITGPDGHESVGTRWNSTTVFQRRGDEWRSIHSHWSFTQHPAFQTMSPEASEGLEPAS